MGKRSWNGFEEYRIKVHEIAQEVAQSDHEVRQHYRSSVATGLICGAMRDPNSSKDPKVIRAAKAQNELATLHEFLVSQGLDWDLIRKEWEPILDPNA